MIARLAVMRVHHFRRMDLAFILALLWLPGMTSLGAAQELPNSPYGKIELLRDTWGIPHIFSDTDIGSMYGLGYATAEDRAFQMYYHLRIIQGRLAEVIGDVKVGITRQRPEGTNSALQNDISMRTIGYFRAAELVAQNLDPETLCFLQAYSQGVNHYINEHPDDLLYLFDKYDLKPESWTPAACIASWWRLGLFFSSDGLRELQTYYQNQSGTARTGVNAAQARTAGRTRQPASPAMPKVDDAASVIQRSDVSDEWIRKLNEYAQSHGLIRIPEVNPIFSLTEGPKFSHAWVARPAYIEGVDRPQPLIHLSNGGENEYKALRK